MRKQINKNEYSLCMPLTGRDMQDLYDEMNEGVAKGYDFFEWRRDYFTAECEEESVYLRLIRNAVKEKGLIYTFRNNREGGVSTLSDQVRLEKIKMAIDTGLMDYIDIELNSPPYFLKKIEEVTKKSSVKKILSYHDFKKMPSDYFIHELLDQMLFYQADVLKIAIHVSSKEDLRRLIKCTLDYSEKTDHPIILVAMGKLGTITRIAPEICGGSLSFASGKKKTAPGQLCCEEIVVQRKVLGLE